MRKFLVAGILFSSVTMMAQAGEPISAIRALDGIDHILSEARFLEMAVDQFDSGPNPQDVSGSCFGLGRIYERALHFSRRYSAAILHVKHLRVPEFEAILRETDDLVYGADSSALRAYCGSDYDASRESNVPAIKSSLGRLKEVLEKTSAHLDSIQKVILTRINASAEITTEK